MASATNFPEPVEIASTDADKTSNTGITPAPASTQSGPVPLSFPAILRNPGSANPYAHLFAEGDAYGSRSSASVKKNRREDRDGKRWVRRKENGGFVITITPIHHMAIIL
jgi:hypothetical protein